MSIFNSILATIRFEMSRVMTLQRMGVAVVMMLFPPAMVFVLDSSGALVAPEFVIAVLCGMICLLSLLLWATSNVYTELEGRSWTFITSRPYGRWSILFGKFLISFVWSFLIAWAALSMCLLQNIGAEFLTTANVTFVAGNDNDAAGDAPTFSPWTPATYGAVVFDSDGSFTYTPNAGFKERDSFTCLVVDAEGSTFTATVDIIVDPVNDSDPEGEFPNSDGSITYTPNADFNGRDSFTYRVEQADGSTSIATFDIAVYPRENRLLIWFNLTIMLFLASMVYSAIFSFLGVIIQRRAMVVAVGYFLIVEIVFALIPAVIGKLAMSYHMLSLLSQWLGWIIPDDESRDNFTEIWGQYPAWVHLGAIFLMTGIMLGASAVIIRSREYITLEDAQV